MIIVEINAVISGSTGNIMLNIAKYARANGHVVYTFAGLRRNEINPEWNIPINRWVNHYFHRFFGKLFGLNEHLSCLSTMRAIHRIKKIKPDLIHIHLLHGCYINYKILFSYLKKTTIPVVWTFHDCWAFTGRCPHFIQLRCGLWRSGCTNCKYSKKMYPQSFFNVSRREWKNKKNAFTSIRQLTIVTPSKWLKTVVEKSFFSKYNSTVINNGIDLTTFYPREKINKNNNYFYVLGVANIWNNKKGLDVFIKLAKLLPSNYRIMLVGTNIRIDEMLPENIISIHKTHNLDELASIYSTADLFLNPTREDNFPTVNIESLACGTPVLTSNVGGSAEIIDDTCGDVANFDDIEETVKKIRFICECAPFSRNKCTERARLFDMNVKYNEYVKLFESFQSNVD